MAALTTTLPTNAGTLVTPVAVAATDTIDRAVMGPKGAYLKINNGNAGTDNVTISDHGTTDAGNALPSNQLSASLTTGQNKIFFIRPEQVNPATGLVTITHSVQTSVTYELYPVG